MQSFETITGRGEAIASSFSECAESYERHAILQKQVAARLAAALEPWSRGLPDGPILEIGAGTGFFTRNLISLFPTRELTVTDLSEKMVQQCRKNLGPDAERGHLEFRKLDAELWRPGRERYALIASNFVAQWFDDPAGTLSRLCDALLPGGLLLVSCPGSESFPEWRSVCRELDLPCSANPLPAAGKMVTRLSEGPFSVDFYEEPYRSQFTDAAAFFRYLKKIGASVPMRSRPLNPRQFRQLLRSWDDTCRNGRLEVTWHLLFLAVKRERE